MGMRTRSLQLLTISLLLCPQGLMAQEGLFGPKTSGPYVAPGRLFSAQLPPGWVPKVFADRLDFIEFRLLHQPGTAWLQVQRTSVFEGSRARQLLVRAVESRLKKLPHFTELQRRDVVVNGIKGASLLGTYWYQGNAQFPRAIEEVYLVLGKDAFELHFECFEPLTSAVADELNKVYESFVPRPAAGSTMPDDDEEDPLDKIPF